MSVRTSLLRTNLRAHEFSTCMTDGTSPMSEPVAWPGGHSQMAQRVRDFDWTTTKLGPTDRWPQTLRHAVQMILDHPLPMVLGWGPDLITIYNDAHEPFLGQRREALGRPFLEVWAEARDIIEPQIAQVFAGEAVQSQDARFVFRRGVEPEEAWFDYSFTPLRDERGAVTGILNTAIETTPTIVAERQVRSNQERKAFLLKLSDALRPLADAAEIEATTTRLLAVHLGADRAMYAEVEGERGAEEGIIRGQYVRGGTDGEPAPGPFPERFTYSRFGADTMAARYRGEDLVVADIANDAAFDETERAAWMSVNVRAAIIATLSKAGRLRAELGVQSTTPRAWTGDDVSLVREVAERTWAAVERARAEASARRGIELQRTLLAELQHRVRNILAMMRSVVGRTSLNKDNLEDFVAHLQGRIDSMARTQALLTRSAAASVRIEEILCDELVALAVPADKYSLGGPGVELGGKAAEVLTLAIHELATNSAKYGVLRDRSAGRLSVRWSCEKRGEKDYLELHWTEQGGHLHTLPTRRGFGSELITQRVPYELNGRGEIMFDPQGLSATIAFPMTNKFSVLQTDEPQAKAL